jgi:hypothetical protein
MDNKKYILSIIGLILFTVSEFLGILTNLNLNMNYNGLWIGLLTCIVMFPLFIVAREKSRLLCLLITLINGFASGCAAGTYYTIKNVDFNILYAILAIFISVVLLAMIFPILSIKIFTKKRLVLTVIICILMLLSALLGWIAINKIFFSIVTFNISAVVFFLYPLISKPVHPKARVKAGTFSELAASSFGALFLIILIVLAIATEGEILDFDGSISSNKNTIKKKLPNSPSNEDYSL